MLLSELYRGGGIPKIGNDVTVYANSVVAGDICLENGCTIGCLSYVNKSVSLNSLVVGIPAKTIRSDT